MVAEVLFIVFLSSIIAQFGYVFHFFSRLYHLPGPPPVAAEKQPVSVIICAKNEAENLKLHLPAILRQRYMNAAGIPMFEVIVVDDGSEDHTAAVLALLQGQYRQLRVVYIAPEAERPLPGKKAALQLGVSTAQYELLVLTDADCRPASEDWLARMSAPLVAGKSVVAGYGQYRKSGGWLNAFIRWETLHSFLQYSSYALAGQPYMAVGRNMACTKAAMLKARQHPAWAKLPSGDDDLLVNAAGQGNHLGIVATRDSFTVSNAKSRWVDWVRQKQRHLSTGKYYRAIPRLLLGTYALVHALGWLLFFLLVFTGDTAAVGITMLARCLVFWLVCYEATQKLDEKDLLPWLPLLDMGWMIYNFAFSPYILWKNKKQWK